MEVSFSRYNKEGDVAVSIDNIIVGGHRFTIAHRFMLKNSKQFKEFLLGFRSFVAHVVNT